MAIKFDLFENPVKEGVSVPKLHAKVITKDVVTTREIREAIRRKCTVSPADVAAVITALNDELYENLSNGYAVHLEGIGYFSLSLKCAPDINPKYIKDDDVQVRSIKFTPDKDWRPLTFSQTGSVPASDIVFAGYGIETPDEATGEDGKARRAVAPAADERRGGTAPDDPEHKRKAEQAEHHHHGGNGELRAVLCEDLLEHGAVTPCRQTAFRHDRCI